MSSEDRDTDGIKGFRRREVLRVAGTTIGGLAIAAPFATGRAFAEGEAVSDAAAAKSFSIVLVHGAFVDGSGWRDTYEILTQRGFEVIVVQNPTVSLAGDVAVTHRAIAAAKHPVILVGHSYGGAVITEAGADPKVHSLVYIAAFAPEVGENVFSLATRPVPGETGAPLLPPRDGFLFVDPAQFPMAFAAGADQQLARFMADSQVPWGLEAVETKITVAAWKAKPSFFMVTTQDRMVQPTLQRDMAKRAGAKTIEIASSHAVMLTHPERVAAFIQSAAA
jgi:pimeloyl-ACP methyl ester carboxylesterase